MAATFGPGKRQEVAKKAAKKAATVKKAGPQVKPASKRPTG